MSFDDNVKREYHMDFDIAEAGNTGDEFSIFSGFPDMQPSTSAGFSSGLSVSTAAFSHGHLIGQMVLDVIEGFLLVVSDSAAIDYASQNVGSFTDYTAEELMHMSLYRILHEDDRQLVKPLIDAAAGAALASPHSSHVTLRLLPNWRPLGAPQSASSSRQPLVLDATLKVQSLANVQPTGSNAPRRYLVCLMKPLQRQHQQQPQQMPWPAKSSQSMTHSPPTCAAASAAGALALSGPGESPSQQNSLSDFISCRHACADSNLVMQAFCSLALASKRSVQAEFFNGRRWSNLVLPDDRPVWQRHVDDVVTGRRESSSGIYRCLMSGSGGVAFVKSRSHLCQEQPDQFASTHCIIRFCDTDLDLQGSPSVSLLRRVGSGSNRNSTAPLLPSLKLEQQQPAPRSALGTRECQELLSLGALYKSCAKQDPERAAALRSRMLALWADSQQQQQQQNQQQQQHHQQQQQQQQQHQQQSQQLKATQAIPRLPPPQPPSVPLFLSSLQRASSGATGGRQPASLLMELLNGPSPHSCAVSITAGTLQDLLNAKESQARAAEQQQVSSTTATPSTPGRKRQPSWPDDCGAGEDVDSSTHTQGKKRPAGTQLLAALLSDSVAAPAGAAAAAVNASVSRQFVPLPEVDVSGDDEEIGVLDSILRSIGDLQQQQQQQLPPTNLAVMQQPCLHPPPPPPPQQQPPPLDSTVSTELPEDVVLDIILDMEERHKHQPAPDSTTPVSGGTGVGLAPGVIASSVAASAGGGGGLLERLLSS